MQIGCLRYDDQSQLDFRGRDYWVNSLIFNTKTLAGFAIKMDLDFIIFVIK